MNDAFDMPYTVDVLREVAAERYAQTAKFGVQDHPWFHPEFGSWAVFTSADDAKAAVDACADVGTLDYAGILTEEYLEVLEAGTIADVRMELVQVAAVAVAAIESIDRNGR